MVMFRYSCVYMKKESAYLANHLSSTAAELLHTFVPVSKPPQTLILFSFPKKDHSKEL